MLTLFKENACKCISEWIQLLVDSKVDPPADGF